MICMYDPLNHNQQDDPNGNGYKNNQNHYTNGTDKQADNTVWNGDCYHYSSPSPQNSTYIPASATDVASEPKRPKPKKRHAFRKIIAGVLTCLIISAGSIAGFTALVNNGTIKLNANGGSTSPAFTITKNSDSVNSTTATATASGELTKQQVAKKIVPSVVCIQNFQAASNTDYTFGFGDSGNSRNNNGGSDDSSLSPTSEGSGIIASSDGYIITNAHVVSGASSLKVILSTGATYKAKLIGSDSVTDLALIKIDATGLTAASFGDSGSLQVADTVMAVGNPGGVELNSTVTVGYVSALNRSITNSETGYTMKCIQTDAAINPGNSGGALVNMKGQVVGINSSKIAATGYEGLGFAIPINTVQPIVSQLKQYGYVKDRAVLGVTGGYIDKYDSQFYNMPTGFYINSVTSSKVTSAGIQKGDVITKIDNTAVTSSNSLSSYIATKKPGDTVKLSVTRPSTGQTFTASVVLSQATGK